MSHKLPTVDEIVSRILVYSDTVQLPKSITWKEKEPYLEKSSPLIKELATQKIKCLAKDEQITCIIESEHGLYIGTNKGKIYLNSTELVSLCQATILSFAIQPDTKILFFTCLRTANNSYPNLELCSIKESLPLFTIDSVSSSDPGGGLAFDSDRCIMFGVGSSATTALNQDHRTLYGKILRVYADTEEIPSENPFHPNHLGQVFRPEIVHSGLRNPTSLFVDAHDELWVTDSSSRFKSEYQNIYKLALPSNCRWAVFDGFRPLKEYSADMSPCNFVLEQASPHTSYQSSSVEAAHKLDFLQTVGDGALGGFLTSSGAFCFADSSGGVYALGPEVNMSHTIVQSDIATLIFQPEDKTVVALCHKTENIILVALSNAEILTLQIIF